MKKNIEIYKMTSSAFLMALAIIFSRIPFLSTYISIGGYNLVKIGFQEIPLLLVCLISGPMYSMIASFGSDLIAAVFFPTAGVFFPGFTFDALILGLVPALFLKIFHHKKREQMVLFLLLNAIVLILSISMIYKLDNIKIGSFNLELALWLKIVLSISIFIVPIIYYIIFKFIKFRTNKKQSIDNSEIFMCFYIRDIILSPLLAPIWIMFLYNIPFPISYLSQIISKMITLPILSILTIVVYRPLTIVANRIIKDTYPVEEAIYTKVINGVRIA